LRVTTDGSSLTLINAHGERLDSEAARADLRAHLGFDPPLASLRFWILGVPDPATASVEVVDAEHRLSNLEQNDWQVEYADYVVVKGAWLPGRMTLRRADVRVRLIVDHWDS
jgi:outer membrane lipoprotein LolB